jgi:hypothetical protein
MEAPRSKTYDGPSGIGRDSLWLTSEDLVEGKDAKVEIESVQLYQEVTFEGGRKKLNVLGLKFKGKDRVLLLNATNRKKLNKSFGNITRAWKGQEITLYVTDTQFAGETVKCVRIRDAKSRVASATEDFLSGDDEPRTSGGQATLDMVAGNGLASKVDEACRVLGLNKSEKAALIEECRGDMAGVLVELNRRADKMR